MTERIKATLKDELMELAERFEAYDPGRSLDNRADELELHQAVVMATGEGSLNAPFDRTFARSLDTSMALVPEGWSKWIYDADESRVICRLERDDESLPELEMGSNAATWELAITAAALRARASIKGSSHVPQ